MSPDYTEDEFEFWFNWDYARTHRPHLMSLGRGGSLNVFRGCFLDACRRDDEELAKMYFDYMVLENDEDAARRFPVDYIRTEDELHQLWLTPALEMDSELYYFIRNVERKPSWWRRVLNLFRRET